MFNTMPVLLGAAAKSLSLSPASLGTLSMTAGIGYLVGTLTGPFWVDRVNRRLASFCIVLGTVISLLTISKLPSEFLLGGFAVFGLFCALASALGMRVLADMPNPERVFGTRLAVELISIGVFLYILSVVFVAKGGFSGGLLGMAMFTALLGLGAFLVPKRSNALAAVKTKWLPSLEQAGPSYAILAIFTVYLMANVGMFFFIGVLAGDFNPSPKQTGLMFTILKWLGGAAGIAGAVIGARAGLRTSHLTALIILYVGLAGLAFAKSFTVFMVSSWVWEFGFTLGCLYQTAAITRFDITNKLVVLVPTAFAVSMILGGKIGGELLSSSGPNGLYILVAICAVLPLLYMVTIRPDPKKYVPA